MMVISESELGIPCDGGKCTRQAHYVCTVRADETLIRLYCAQCTATLLQGVAKVLHEGESLHDHVDTVHLLTGASINA